MYTSGLAVTGEGVRIGPVLYTFMPVTGPASRAIGVLHACDHGVPRSQPQGSYQTNAVKRHIGAEKGAEIGLMVRCDRSGDI